MPYTGNKPSAVPLTSADIADGIITSAKIVDGTIVNADINASAAIVSTKLSGVTSPAAFRNIVINGDMQIAQRSTSVASITTSGYYTLDRMRFGVGLGTWTMSQSTDVPSGYGFTNSLKLDCTTANASPSASSDLSCSVRFEGQNLQYLKKGTANAVSLTLSFWVKSTKTGTFICELNDFDNSRAISKSYTVSASNTWEFKTVTFAGDTTGAFDNNNDASLELNFWLAAGTNYTSGTLQTSWSSSTTANRAVGQVNIADSTSNDWLITGVQLEAGTSATDFEFLPYDVDLLRCQRYYQNIVNGTNTYLCSFGNYTSTVGFGTIHFPTTMRGTPTLVATSALNAYTQVRNGGTDSFNSLGLDGASINSAGVTNSTEISGTAGQYGVCQSGSSTVAFSAEL